MDLDLVGRFLQLHFCQSVSDLWSGEGNSSFILHFLGAGDSLSMTMRLRQGSENFSEGYNEVHCCMINFLSIQSIITYQHFKVI
jgi:hypothetical protein